MIYFSGICRTEHKMMKKKTTGDMFIIESLEMLLAVNLQC